MLGHLIGLCLAPPARAPGVMEGRAAKRLVLDVEFHLSGSYPGSKEPALIQQVGNMA